jgi:hypothetical protein
MDKEIKQDLKICINTKLSVDDYKQAIGIGRASNNNYASCYAVPISTPKSERKGHNGMHESHISKK